MKKTIMFVEIVLYLNFLKTLGDFKSGVIVGVGVGVGVSVGVGVGVPLPFMIET